MTISSPTPRELEGREWFSVAQAAVYSNWSQKKVLRGLRSGHLHGEQIAPGHAWRIHRSDLNTWLREGSPS